MSSVRASYVGSPPPHRSVRRLLASALLVAACGGGGQSAAPPKPGGAPAAPAAGDGAANSPGSSGAASSGQGATRARIRDKEALDKHVEVVGSVGALIGVSARCSLIALKQFKLVGARDLLYMQTGVHPENANNSRPMCTTQVFSPTEKPRLQWNVTVTAQEGGKLSTERKRPDTFRPPSEEESTRLAAVLAAVQSTKGRGLMVPVVIAAPDGWVVYLMRYSDSPDTLAAGPHYRAFVSSDAKTVTKSELLGDGEDIPLTLEGGKRVDAVKVPFDKPVPNEAHVFMSVMARVPLLVRTELGEWLVSSQGVKLTEPAP